MNLEAKIERSYNMLDALPKDKEYLLAFSGGKDSHVLLALYLKWCELRGEALNVKVVFSDTGLEVNKLYHLIDCVKEACKGKVEFIQTKPDITRSYWVTQFGLGYPVPTYRNRWCTNNLKVRPMKAIPGIALTGVHLGESSKRDKRIKDCRDGECGLSDLSNGLEPISDGVTVMYGTISQCISMVYYTKGVVIT
jgi:DNA sulfur modification protein DndC